jgi:polar amino acid transport system ATP-binding protein
MSDYEYILKTEHLSKSFGSLEVLKDISLAVKRAR